LILCGAVQPLDAQRALRQRVDAYFAAAVAGGDFAGSVLIARGDSILVNKSYGLANIELNVPATPSTRYVIASLTKTLTAAAIIRLRDQGRRVSHVQVRYLHPLNPRLEPLMRRFRRVLVAELNMGQLLMVLRARTLIDCVGLNKIQGQPFKVAEVMKAVEELLDNQGSTDLRAVP
jgi:pyruvate/2-oxoacid:ferredoxin oxidoreductase alpha subunit